MGHSKSSSKDRPTGETPSESLVDKITSNMLSGADSAELRADIDELLVFFQYKWEEITFRFGPMKLAALVPRGTLRRQKWWQFWR